MNKNLNNILNLSCYSIGHAIVDAASIGVTFSIGYSAGMNYEKFLTLILLYNVLSFGLQTPLGLIADSIKRPQFSAIAGCIIVSLSVVFPLSMPVFAVCLAGIGNALFHIGGGVISLNISRHRAAAPGIYVAPGDFGVFLGLMLGRSGNFSGLPFIILLSATCIAIILLKPPDIDYDRDKNRSETMVRPIILIFTMLFITVFLRSLIGLGVSFPWKTGMPLIVMFTLFLVIGKAIGGILADRFGWTLVSVICLLASMPLISFYKDVPSFALAGIFLFQMTMPVTLTAMSSILPGRPAFAFGITCLALLLGGLPVFTPLRPFCNNQWVNFVSILASVVALFIALRIYFKLSLNPIIKK